MSQTDCLFCRIVDGEIPSHTVYEDESTLAFLDVNPLARGHTVVIPKRHYERVGDLPAAVASGMGRAVSTVADAVEAGVDAPATTIAYNNGEAAGQEVPHVHAHVIPRFEDDGAGPIHALFAGVDLDDDELAAVAEGIVAETET
ncbi:MAG: HIT family protein [Salinirussus sp.]